MIRIYTGPMWCGKTQRLVKDIWREKTSFDPRYDKIEVYKSAKDLRDPEDEENPALRTRNPDDPSDYIPLTKCERLYDADVEALKKNAKSRWLTVIDEAMLIEKGLLDLVIHFVREDEGDLWLAGLDRTSEGDGFGEFATCLKYAHEIIYLTARCEGGNNCKIPASMTFYEGEKTDTIQVGDAGYKPLCAICWPVLKVLKERREKGI